MRSLVFSCATTVAPPARSGALLSVWSKCQCVLITNFTGAPNPLSDSWSVGHAGATNVSTTTSPSEPCSTTTLPPGPASRVRFSASGCDSIGMAPMRARNAATGSCGCCRAPPPAARASLRGMSPSTRAPAPIAAITRNHSRRVLLVTLLLTVHPPLEVRCNMSRGEAPARYICPPVAPRVLTPYLPRSGVLTPLTPSPFGRGGALCNLPGAHAHTATTCSLARCFGLVVGTRGASMALMDPLRRVPPGRKFTQARELRRAATSTERYAWSLLRKRGVLGLKFRRQHVLHGFVVDFYCAAERLVLELEGDGHDESDRKAYDTARVRLLEAAGYRVVRVRNRDVARQRLEALLGHAIRRMPIVPPLPKGEGDRG